LGPILLFRFDALVTLTLLFSLLAFIKRKFAWSGFCLGLATGMKVFPVIVLPYLLMILIKQKQLKSLLLLLIYFGEALLLPVLIFFLLGGNWQQIIGALNFHNLKLISIESLPGSFITGWSLITTGQPPPLLAGYGIWAIPGPAALFNRLWVVPIGLVYYFIWNQRSKYFNWSVPLALMLVFLVFSKNLNPQYIWWFMALLPFVKAGRAIWVLTLAVTLLNQLVYPIFYTTLIEEFYQKNSSYWIYYLLLLRNLGIAALAYLSLKTLYPDSSKTKGKLALK
ncbi:MAG: glycosyltransferase 87 family protein, partial [Patescibacteria group bacterium]|nr:glycosyltransferase 87 family protein [Patescibacteria group bacterium]